MRSEKVLFPLSPQTSFCASHLRLLKPLLEVTIHVRNNAIPAHTTFYHTWAHITSFFWETIDHYACLQFHTNMPRIPQKLGLFEVKNECSYLWRNNGKVLLATFPLVKIVNVARFFHHITSHMVQVSISSSILQHLPVTQV